MRPIIVGASQQWLKRQTVATRRQIHLRDILHYKPSFVPLAKQFHALGTQSDPKIGFIYNEILERYCRILRCHSCDILHVGSQIMSLRFFSYSGSKTWKSTSPDRWNNLMVMGMGWWFPRTNIYQFNPNHNNTPVHHADKKFIHTSNQRPLLRICLPVFYLLLMCWNTPLNPASNRRYQDGIFATIASWGPAG